MCSEPITWLRKRAPGISARGAYLHGSVDRILNLRQNANRPRKEGGYDPGTNRGLWQSWKVISGLGLPGILPTSCWQFDLNPLFPSTLPSVTRQFAGQKRVRLAEKRYSGLWCPNFTPVVVEPLRAGWKTPAGCLSTGGRSGLHGERGEDLLCLHGNNWALCILCRETDV